MKTNELKEEIISEIKKAFEKSFSKSLEKVELEFPPSVTLGDFAVAFFRESKELKISPAEIAKVVADNFEKPEWLEKVEPAGPYLNIKVKNNILFETVLSEVNEKPEKYGNSNSGKNQKVMVEYLSPNTNKPLHLGHARNGALGMAVANILETTGHNVIKGILVNDRGVHICKSMLAWKKWGNNETPESAKMKGDHFIGKWYVRYAVEVEKNPELEKEVQEMLQKWEAGDAETLKLWKTMNEWVYAGFQETYEKFGLKFDEFFHESETYKLGKDIIEAGLRKNVFRRDENGAVVFDLPESEFGKDEQGENKKTTVLRADGTSVYITQDLGTAVTRAEKFKLDKMIYVVGNEQNFHFQVLFKILQSLGYAFTKNLHHLSYAMVNLPDGKMKSREGKVVDTDNLILEVEKIVAEEVGKRDAKISEEEKKERAKIIAVGAIKFYLLRVKPSQSIAFDPKESVAIDGFTGPYCQYAYARISGIIRNLKDSDFQGEIDFSLLGNLDERTLLKRITKFPEEIEKAALELNPLRVVTSVYETAQAFNLFYNNNKVLDPENEKLSIARLELAKATAVVLKRGLNILGIETLERM
jgi:arginyl-tRNA synthetase